MGFYWSYVLLVNYLMLTLKDYPGGDEGCHTHWLLSDEVLLFLAIVGTMSP